MQFNTAYLRELARYGITADDVAAKGCYSFELAAWRLRGHIKNDKGDLWTRAANYHSRTPRYNTSYRADLRVKAAEWAKWLEARFVTVDVTKTGLAPSMPATVETVQASTPQKAAASATSAKATRRVAWDTAGYVPRKLIINGKP